MNADLDREWSTKLTHESAGMRTLIESLIVKQEAGVDNLAAKIERLGLENESRIADATNALTQKITYVTCYFGTPFCSR